MLPICVPCKVQMKVRKNGVDLELMAGSNPYQIWSGDLYECPRCSVQIVSGFGKEPVAQHFQAERYAKFLPGVFTRFWSTLKEKHEAEQVTK